MVLNNYWKAVRNLGLMYGGSGTFDSGMINVSGTAIPNLLTYISGTASAGLWQIRTKGISARVGKGDAAVTVNDYSLDDDCTASFDNYSVTHNLGIDNALTDVFTISGDNNTGSEITLTEVGITKTYSGQNEVSDSSTQEVMFARLLLSTPVTVPAGGSFQLSVKWEEK